MKFDELVRAFAHRPWFDLESAIVFSGSGAQVMHTVLYRWREAGKLVELRRGLYAFAEPWRHVPLEGWEPANAIYPPSWLSGAWVLARGGVLPPPPEPVLTSMTTRPAQEFDNPFGRFTYDILPGDLAFGFTTENSAAGPVRVALPEKALLDWWFVSGGEWPRERLAEAGLDHARLDLSLLRGLAARSGRPRLVSAAKALSRMAKPPAVRSRASGKAPGQGSSGAPDPAAAEDSTGTVAEAAAEAVAGTAP